MLHSDKTDKYEIRQFDVDLKKSDVNEKSLLRKGFVRNRGYLSYEKKHRKLTAYIAVEDYENENNIYAIGLAILKFLELYHVTNIGVLVVDGIMEEYAEITEKRAGILYLHFNSTTNPLCIPENYAYKGICFYEIFTYPFMGDEWNKINFPKLIGIAQSCGLNCKEIDGRICGEDEFTDLYATEKKLIAFSNKTEAIDQENGTWTRVEVTRATLPVVNDDYYSDLFYTTKRSCENVRYLGCAGELLQSCAGVFVETNINTDENIKSLYECIETFVEDING